MGNTNRQKNVYEFQCKVITQLRKRKKNKVEITAEANVMAAKYALSQRLKYQKLNCEMRQFTIIYLNVTHYCTDLS